MGGEDFADLARTVASDANQAQWPRYAAGDCKILLFNRDGTAGARVDPW